jgi:hypothetical protein
MGVQVDFPFDVSFVFLFWNQQTFTGKRLTPNFQQTTTSHVALLATCNQANSRLKRRSHRVFYFTESGA